MSIWGIIIGGATGAMLGGPIGALLGAAAGHVASREIGKRLNPEAEARTRQVAFTVAVVALSAKMAKADGTVTRSEINAFRRKVHIPEKDVRDVGRFWDLARQTPDGFEAYAKQAASLFGPKNAILEQLLELLFFIAAADGEISAPEWAYLAEVSRLFGYDENEFNRFCTLYGGNDESPYAVLDLPEKADIEQVRNRWKELNKRYHPDRLIAEGLPQEFIHSAEERLARINAAYDVIKRHQEGHS